MAGDHLGRFPVATRPRTPGLGASGERGDESSAGAISRVAVGADHGGFAAKQVLVAYLQSAGYRVVDVGTYSGDRCDYPDYAREVALRVAREECDRGIMIDAAGIGSSMVCNKVHGVRAALCYSRETVVNSRAHNNANVLTLGANFHDAAQLCELALVWLQTAFEGGRHWPRINKMMATERTGIVRRAE